MPKSPKLTIDPNLTVATREFSLIAACDLTPPHLHESLQPVCESLKVCWGNLGFLQLGYWQLSTHTLALNVRAIGKIHAADFAETLLHETAHAVTDAVWEVVGGTRPKAHGSEWKRACALLGIPGEDRCHRVDLGARWAGSCKPGCRAFHRRVRRPPEVSYYKCCACGSQVEWEDRGTVPLTKGQKPSGEFIDGILEVVWARKNLKKQKEGRLEWRRLLSRYEPREGFCVGILGSDALDDLRHLTKPVMGIRFGFGSSLQYFTLPDTLEDRADFAVTLAALISTLPSFQNPAK